MRPKPEIDQKIKALAFELGVDYRTAASILGKRGAAKAKAKRKKESKQLELPLIA